MFAKAAHDTEKGKVPYALDNFQESTRGIVKLHVTNFRSQIKQGTGDGGALENN